MLVCNKESRNAASIVGLKSRHQGLDPSDARGVARIHLPSNTGCGNDSLDVSNDIGYCIKQVKIKGLINLEDDNVSSTLHGTVSSARWQRSQKATVRRKTSRGDVREQLHTFHQWSDG